MVLTRSEDYNILLGAPVWEHQDQCLCHPAHFTGWSVPSDRRCREEYQYAVGSWNARAESFNRLAASIREEQKTADSNIVVAMLESEWSMYLLPEDYHSAVHSGKILAHIRLPPPLVEVDLE